MRLCRVYLDSHREWPPRDKQTLLSRQRKKMSRLRFELLSKRLGERLTNRTDRLRTDMTVDAQND